MKKIALTLAFATTCFANATLAQDSAEKPPYENWVGVFGQYHQADSDKPDPVGGLDDGRGLGGELGFRFDPTWAVRFELTRLLIDNDSSVAASLADDGTMLGADLMYFLEDDAAYLFGGVREQSLRDSYRMVSLGVGKHWAVSEDWRVITEAAAYHDIGQNYQDFSLKLGLAYIFGERSTGTIERPDSDGDGVYDAVDRCPNTPPGTQVDATGCNIDLDGDGVINAMDECPRTPVGVAVNERGCPLKDSDGDGVTDDMDECPDTPATDRVDEVGCSVFEQVEVFVEIDILFENDSSEVTNPRSELILEFVDFMNRFPNTSAVIEGHTSAVGDTDYNQALSQRRADAIRQLLIDEYSIDASRLDAVGFGESRLKFNDDTEEAHRLNRRTEARVTATVEEKVTRD
ncbi:OmpA family protein [Glaciecola sp. XM2]|uniref:OmpA family protein n=1 Tax=Glaciecola sp. XM2 TaxID=1914931 RepID=UPI001BDE86DB|nr:OmpA family protein [Glaciecola sp. XM2]MBT1449966.1 OmpA family protein [Glaciecola sp. XM2]